MQRSSNSNYSYPPPGYPQNNPPPQGGYPHSYDQNAGARPHYPPTSNVRAGQHPTPYYTPIAPAPPPSTSQYPSPPGYPSQYPTASDNRGYQASNSYPYNPSGPRSASPPTSYHRPNQAPPRKFIPTPSEAYANPRPPRPSSAMHGRAPYSSAHPGMPPAARPPHPHQSSSARPRSSMGIAPLASSSTSAERYICEVCGKDFSRAHDRKRHHETQHAATPVTHKCIYCDKDFSRADSLKRHIQNGCDEAPPQ
ncbi:hypothetical protein FB451DRAFT_1178399 [Mycena latifolia]|nr:hypothetical protein FB451DRAFT_1178399 [Mycena latifolia]